MRTTPMERSRAEGGDLVAGSIAIAHVVAKRPAPGHLRHMGQGNGYGVANWIDLVGMAALPVVGLVMAVPQVLGLSLPDDGLFRRLLRTVHLAVGYTTVGTFVATTAIDL